MTPTHLRYLVSATILLGLFTAPAVAQPTIVIDYSFDTNNFFGTSVAPDVLRRTALETAALRLSSRLADNLTAITPSGQNTWTADFANPATGLQVSVNNPTIAANVIRVYAGGRDLAGSTLGVGGPGGFSASGVTQEWLNTVAARGQSGALLPTPTDFGPWGGSITFDTVGPNWNFNLTPPSSGQADFLSVAEHELGHLLGFGTAASWTNRVSGGFFTGPVSTSLFGSPPPVSSGHWAEGTTYLGQEVAMDPSITLGTRKEFTELDFAGLTDLGWQVVPVPEPTTILGVAVGVAGAWSGVRRLRRKPESADAAPATAC